MSDNSKAQDRLQGFEGFRIPSYTPIPDQLLDSLLDVLTHGQLKVLLYIMRHTFGFKKSVDELSARQISEGIVRRDGRQLDHGTGLSIRQVRTVIAALETLGLIDVTRGSGNAGSQRNQYSIRIQKTPSGGEVEFTPPPEAHFTPWGEPGFTPQESFFKK